MIPEQKIDILEILDGAKDMTVATVREDGYPQATTVSFVHDGLDIYFGCDANSQKARNIKRNNKVSLTVNLPYRKWTEIRGVSIGGRAHFVTDRADIERVFEMMVAKFPQVKEYAPDNERDQIGVVRVEPELISLLDYGKGFGHTEEIRVKD